MTLRTAAANASIKSRKPSLRRAVRSAGSSPCNFTNSKGSATTTKVRDILFGAGDSIDRYYRECSFGNLSFSGDVVGPYTIPHPNDGSDGYTPAGWAWAAEKMAAAAGVNLSLYTQKVYVLAPTTAYWAGTAFLGGNQAWVNGGYWSDKGVYAHEIGHCLGMYHASTPRPSMETART